MATHSSTVAWKSPWTEEPGGLQSMGSLRVGHDWATSLSLFTFTHWKRKWQPTPVFLPGESQGQGSWWAAISGVAQSRTRLKRLSSSSRICLTFYWRQRISTNSFDLQNNASYHFHLAQKYSEVKVIKWLWWLLEWGSRIGIVTSFPWPKSSFFSLHHSESHCVKC